MFDGFALEEIDVGEVRLRVRHGRGPDRAADDVRTASIDSGHHMAEEAPERLAAVLTAFLAAA
ncbi:hypothetical protein [Micromonospora sp. NPDC048830]|uniref:hypothetical protein n=1 Tax=Micromonospora sp. NPDC048830 TaxID=3364257 RepID=UPI00371DE4EE